MQQPWLQPSVLLLLALVVVIGASSLDDSRGEEAFLRVERRDCASGICRRNSNDDKDKITERDDLAELTNSYQESERENRRCMSLACRLRRQFGIDEIDNSYDDDGNDDIYDEKRSMVKMNGLSRNDDIMIEDKRSTRTKEGLFNDGVSDRRSTRTDDKSRKRCLAWFCNDSGKRASNNLETKRETTSKEESCMSWHCVGKRMKERMDLIRNPSKRKLVENLDSMTAKRFSVSNMLKKQRDGRVKCLSWDCKRDMIVQDSSSQKRDVNADREFRKFLKRRNFAGVDAVSNYHIHYIRDTITMD